AVGVYGLTSYSVASRTHDIGLRMALGATRADIFKHIIGRALVLALIGIGIGVVLAIVSGRVIKSLLYGISSSDPTILAVTALVLLMVALLASYLPARRATRADPMLMLRRE